ncbi:hypothetical protein CC79DRAFT_1318988 [Sarocladium strictum]
MPEGSKISPPPASGAGRDEKHADAGRWREGSSAQIYGTLSVRDPRLQPFEHAAEARSSPELTPQEQESDLAASGDTSPWESHLAPTPTQSDDEDAISSVTEATSQHQDVASLSKREHEVWDRTLRGYNLCFQYQHKSIEDVDAYHAVLLVRAKNIETLMKKGLYFDQRNVIPRKSFILQNPEVAWVSKSDWKVIRSLELSDTSFFKSWTAVIWVYANTLPPVASFRVTDLTPEKCTEAKGWDKHLIYLYDKRYPELSINTWLDDRPMDGIWPWPRSEQSCSKSPEPRAPTAFTDIPALPRGQPSILLDFVYPQ